MLDGHTAAVEVWIDRSVDGNVDPDSVNTAAKFCWDRGRVRVHLHHTHVGLYGKPGQN